MANSNRPAHRGPCQEAVCRPVKCILKWCGISVASFEKFGSWQRCLEIRLQGRSRCMIDCLGTGSGRVSPAETCCSRCTGFTVPALRTLASAHLNLYSHPPTWSTRSNSNATSSSKSTDFHKQQMKWNRNEREAQRFSRRSLQRRRRLMHHDVTVTYHFQLAS